MSDTPQLIIFGSWFDGHTDTRPKPFEMPWSDFVSAIAGQFRTREDKFAAGAGFNLARFVERDGTINRDNKHVDVLSGIVLDFDKDFDFDVVTARIEGLTWLAYTTFNHRAAAPRWRLVIPFSQPIPAPTFRAVRQWLLNRINEGGGRRVQEADEQAKALSNFFFGPGCPAAAADEAEWRVSEGAVLVAPAVSEFKRGVPQTRVLGSTVDWAFLHARMKTHKDATIRAAFKCVLKGKSFAALGSRNTTLSRMCGALAGWALACNPEELASVFATSLTVMREEQPNDPPPDITFAADNIARAQAGMVAQANEENADRAADAQEVAVVMPADDEALLPAAAAAGFDDIDTLRRHLLLRNGNALWMWRTDLGTWAGPFTEPEVQASARLDLATVPGVLVHQRKADGGLRLKVLPEIFHDYGQRADKVSYDLELTSSRFDVATRHLRLVAAPRRPLTPTFDAEVSEWLAALGGDKADRLLDWLTGMTQHSRPNSVLFLRGDPSTGKGLLVRGLARIWECDAAVDMKRIAESFNDDLLRCPLVRIDEGKWSKFVDVTTTLRELVTQSSRMINAKNQKLVELIGHLRFIVTANNFNIFASDSHSLTPADRDAIAERFFEVMPYPRAAELLAKKHPDRVASMALDNRIAAHVLWLCENRTVESTGRFIVEGDRGGRFATRIITEDHSWGSWVVEWLARYLTDPMSIEREQAHLLSRGEGSVLVSPEAVVNTFDRTLKNKKAPQAAEISNALRSLSTGELLPFPNGKGRGFEVLVEEVALWSDEKGVGNPQQIRANARAPRIVQRPQTPPAPMPRDAGKGFNRVDAF